MGIPTVYHSLQKEEQVVDVPLESDKPLPIDASDLSSRLRNDDATKKLFRPDNFLRSYISILVLFLLAALFAVAWSFTGPTVDDSPAIRRVFRTGKNVPVDQLYSGLALSAILAPCGILVQWIVHDFRRLHLFALATERPIRVGDLDEIGDNSSVWTLRTVAKYSWWYGLMQSVLLMTRSLIVPVGTLILTVGPYSHNSPGEGVVGLPILPTESTVGSIVALSSAMGGSLNGTFRPSLAKNDTFLSQAVYTFVGNIVSQNALVKVDSGVWGPVPTHNLTFQGNTTYDGVVFFHWDAHCEVAREVEYEFYQNESNTTYSFTLPDGSVESIELGPKSDGSQHLKLWNDSANKTINDVPVAGTSYFISATRSIPTINSTALLDRGADQSLVQTDGGDWVSRSKCTPSLEWSVGSCVFNGTDMTSCAPNPGSNTTVLDTAALDALSLYMTAIPWYIFINRIAIVDDTLDALYSIPTSEDWGHFFGNIAHAVTSISTAGYFGTATVPTVSVVTEQVYIVRTSILIAVTGMLALAVAVTLTDVARNYRRGLPYYPAGFLAIAHAVRGPWWERELEGSHTWDLVKSQESNTSTVMFGVDTVDPRYIRLAPSVIPIHR